MVDSRGIHIYIPDEGMRAEFRQALILGEVIDSIHIIDTPDTEIFELVSDIKYTEFDLKLLEEEKPKDWYRKFEKKRRW